MKNFCFALSILISFGLLGAKSAHASGILLSPEQKLERLRPHIGEAAANFLQRGRMDFLKSCHFQDDAEDPDYRSGLRDVLDTSPRLSAYKEVYDHGGNTTDRTANNGIISYMASSLMTEPAFYQSAFQFYAWLGQQDDSWRRKYKDELTTSGPKNPGWAPISLEPSNREIYTMARKFAGENEYLALKIMSLYGHDNMFKKVSSKNADCRLVVMDAVSPVSSSQLYQNGAIDFVRYSPDMIKRGQNVAQSCKRTYEKFKTEDSSPAYELFKLCNDTYDEYQADYYHVLASAFMSCRGQIAENRGKFATGMSFGSIPYLSDTVVKSGQFLAIRSYKAQRFQEEIDKAFLPKKTVSFLKLALGQIAVGTDPFGTAWDIYRKDLSHSQADATSAVIKRWQHEIEFRQYQNKMGTSLGDRACKGQKTYNIEGHPPGNFTCPTGNHQSI